MKKKTTLTIALTILLLNVKANHLSSNLKLQLFNHANMMVEFDHLRYQNPSNAFCLNDVEPGTHHLTVYKMREHGYHHNAQRVLMFAGFIQVPASSEISAVINPYYEYDVISILPKCAPVVYQNPYNPYYNPAPVCGMNAAAFESLKRSIENKSFDETRLTIAKQAIQYNTLTSRQVAELVNLMTFEYTKLSLAKYAYRYAVDPENYFVLNDEFTFESSIDELNNYIQRKS